MGRLFESAEERAIGQALELAQGLRPPVTARSRPTAEVRGKSCLLGAIVQGARRARARARSGRS